MDRHSRRLLLAGLAAIVLLCPRLAIAHEFSTSYGTFRIAGAEVRVTLTLTLTDLHLGPTVDLNADGSVSPEEFQETIDATLAAIRDNYQVGAPDPPSRVTIRAYTLASPTVGRLELLYVFDHDVTDLHVASRLDRITQENHQHLLQFGQGPDARHVVLDRTHPEIDIDHAAGIPFWTTIADFVALGIGHIVTGYDHLAFLVALLLATTTLLSLVKVVTSFTVAHSVTLAIATLGLVAIPSRVIESLIALSIAYVAIENFMGRTLVHRWKITFLFGLIHGFGFSNVLRAMELTPSRLAISLFSFNAGVEVGQVLFVAILFPPLLYLGRSRWKEQVLSGASVVIMSLGFYWFVQRAILG